MLRKFCLAPVVLFSSCTCNPDNSLKCGNYYFSFDKAAGQGCSDAAMGWLVILGFIIIVLAAIKYLWKG